MGEEVVLFSDISSQQASRQPTLKKGIAQDLRDSSCSDFKINI
jgi:hypothetical protein